MYRVRYKIANSPVEEIFTLKSVEDIKLHVGEQALLWIKDECGENVFRHEKQKVY